jgi:effector-binding domain-containing protein
MQLTDSGIIYKKINETLVASIRQSIKNRDEMTQIISKLATEIPEDIIIGPAFSKTVWVTSIKPEDGMDIEIGFPVSEPFNKDEIKSKTMEKREVLSITHHGSFEQRNETYQKLLNYTRERGFISSEYIIENFLDNNNPKGGSLELQFVIHNWQELLYNHSHRVLEENDLAKIIPEPLVLDASLEERFNWASEVIKGIKTHTNDFELYDILSSCAHVFPFEPILKMKQVYEKERKRTTPLEAIDSVINMMSDDNAWADRPIRQGNRIIEIKSPADPKAFKKASNPVEKRKAACFCPVIKNYLEDDIPREYCYCSAGWFRRQWEVTLSKPVKVDLDKSVAQGDDVCRFIIHIPEDL